MPSGPKKKRAEMKKKHVDTHSTIPQPDEKLVTDVELPEVVSISNEYMPKESGSVDEVISDVGFEMDSKEKESESVDNQIIPEESMVKPDSDSVDEASSVLDVSDLAFSEMDSKERKKKESEFVGDQISSEESLVKHVSKSFDEVSSVLDGAASEMGTNEIKEKGFEYVDDLSISEESLIKPALSKMQGNERMMDPVDQLTADLSVGLVISEKAQDSLTESLQSVFVEQRAIIDPVSYQSEVVGRLKEILDELVHHSENQLKFYKEMSLNISPLLDEQFSSGKPAELN